jgi:phosphate transport system substrate-binding protein
VVARVTHDVGLPLAGYRRRLAVAARAPIEATKTGMRPPVARGVGLFLVLVLAAGCGPSSQGGKDALAGTYFGSGSGAGLEQVQALANGFSALHPEVVFKLDDAGSETGVTLIQQNRIDFGYMSREPTADEARVISLSPLTGTGTAVAVNAANPVTGLTKAQVRDIFAGLITDWGAVGGQPGHAIQVLVREAESSTRSSFEAYFFDGAKPTYPGALNVVESKEMYAQIRGVKDSIGMVTLQTSTQVDPTMRLLALNGLAATTANIGNGSYPIRRPVYFFTAADPARVKPAVQAFLEFMKSPEGVQILSAF